MIHSDFIRQKTAFINVDPLSGKYIPPRFVLLAVPSFIPQLLSAMPRFGARHVGQVSAGLNGQSGRREPREQTLSRDNLCVAAATTAPELCTSPDSATRICCTCNLAQK